MSFLKTIKSADRHADSAGDINVELFEYSSDLLIYRGVNNDLNALTSADTWHIAKYTYTGTNVTQIEYISDVAWDDRATLDWR